MDRQSLIWLVSNSSVMSTSGYPFLVLENDVCKVDVVLDGLVVACLDGDARSLVVARQDSQFM